MPFTETEQTEAAKALDITDLPIGTWVRWITDQGFSGRRRDSGEITSVTEKSYVVRTYLGHTARLSRTLDDLGKRRVAVLRTAQEQEAYKVEAARVRLEQAAERQRQQGEAETRRLQRAAEGRATEALIARYRDEHTALVAEELAKGSGG